MGHTEVAALAKTFREAYAAVHHEQPTYVNARRDFILGPDPREASVQAGRNEPYFQFGPGHRYIIGGLQESTTVDLHLAKVEDDATGFAFCGAYQDMPSSLPKCRMRQG